MPAELIDAIGKLERDQALEAARFLCQALVGDEVADESAPELEAIVERPFFYLPEVETLARLVLLSAAASPEGADEVRKAIDGVGRKQFILGGGEIVALAAIAVVALNISLRGGRGRVVTQMKVTEVRGKPCVEIKQIDEPISISTEVAGILRSVLHRGKSE
jgi:hypothetical protein